jgi:hypothetical protein
MVGINPAFNWQRFGGNALQDIGYGLGQAPTIWGGLAAGAQRNADLGPQRQQLATLEEERQREAFEKNQTSEWIKANFPQYNNLPPAQAWQAAMGDLAAQRAAASGSGGPSPTADMQNYEYGLAHPGFLDFQTQRGGAAETSLTPTWGIDSDPQSPTFNKPVLGQLNKAGQFVKTELPAGVQPMNPMDLAGGKAGATVDAKTSAEARAQLPGAEQAVSIAKNAIALIRNDEKGLADQFGNTGPIPNRNLPVVPGVFGQDRGNWQANFSQANGQAFMQARQMLKGGGPITDYEGMKGEAAYSRMQAAVEKGDKENFLRALADFEEAVDQGYQKLVDTANSAYAAGGPAVPASTTYTFNPATGELE